MTTKVSKIVRQGVWEPGASFFFTIACFFRGNGVGVRLWPVLKTLSARIHHFHSRHSHRQWCHSHFPLHTPPLKLRLCYQRYYDTGVGAPSDIQAQTRHRPRDQPLPRPQPWSIAGYQGDTTLSPFTWSPGWPTFPRDIESPFCLSSSGTHW